MIRFILRRALTLIPVLWIVLTVVFFMMRLAPGGPFDEERPLGPQARERVRAYYDLDASLAAQYGKYMGKLLQGDLGPSLRSSFSVGERIALTFRVSLELGVYSLLFALTFGLTAGMVAASRPNAWRDRAAMSLATLGICIPNMVLGPVLVIFFAIHLAWVPSSGWDTALSKVLPTLTLGTAYTAYIARLARGGMLEVMGRDFIRTARAKGLGDFQIVARHALRGGLQPVVAFIGPAAAGLLSGSFVVETVFDVPGLGTEFISAANSRDYTMVLGAVLVYAILILVFNLAVEVAQVWLDPRSRPE